MIRVTVIRPDNSVYGYIDLPNETAIDSWIAECTANGSNWVQTGCTLQRTDVSAQATKDQLVAQSLKNQSIGASIIANVAATNEMKLAANTMSQQTFTALLADQNVLNIERLLWNGSLVTAKALIQATDLSAYYTSDEIATILALFP
jgi:hypothetical protein